MNETRKWLCVGAAAALIGCGLAATASAATAVIPAPYKNCTQFNAKYHHGVGRVGAQDHTSGEPVTTFLRSNRIYRLVLKHHVGLDRDKDGIACEKA